MSKGEPRIIKRYQNRKLYDTMDSCYVTLEEISDLIKAGEEVKIIDNATKDDLTGMTLAQIIFEEQKRKTHELPLATFTDIIRSGGGALRELVSRTIVSGVREIGHVREAMETVRDLPAVQAEIKLLREKIDALEAKLKTRETRRS